MTEMYERYRQLLREAGVPFYVIPFTLRECGWELWHEFVVERSYEKTDAIDNIFLFSNKMDKYADTVRLGHLLGKELALNNESVYVTSLATIADALEDDNEKMLKRLQAKIVIVDDFFEAGSAFPLPPRTTMIVKRWMYDRIESPNRGLFLCSSAPLSRVSEWWGEAFAHRIRASLMQFETK